MTISYTRERHVAELAVLRASILTKRVQSTVHEISKDDNSPVTIADFAAQALLIGAIRAAFPNDALLGEEDSAALRADKELREKVYELVSSATDVLDPLARGRALPKPKSVQEMLDLIDLGGCERGGNKGRVWIMDPIDGTAAFLKGQQYAVSLALIEDGKEVIGVLGCPNISAEMTRVSEEDVDQKLGTMLTAVRGRGSTTRIMTQSGLSAASPLNLLKPFSSENLHIVDCTASMSSRHDLVAKLADDFNTAFPNTEVWSSHIRYAALIIGGGDVQFWIPTPQPSKMSNQKKMSNPLRTTAQTTRIAGHRGHSAGAPENTLAAFRKARALAGPGVTCETDLALTRDDELVLIHDETVDRTTDGHGLVREMTYSEIAKLDAGRWFDEKFAGERIPLLRDALSLARDVGIIYQVELKIYNQNDKIFAKLKALIDELGCADLLQFSSFDFVQLRAVKEAIPDVPTVALSHSRLIDPAAVAQQANVDAVNLEIQHFPSGEARQLHDGGFAVFLHVPRPERLESLKKYGVDIEAQAVGWVREGLLDQVISDDVEQVVRIMNEARGE
ncbi:hypothetical protein CDV31_010609 [Fusarium ambrosium]|uniref:GP-PDE domain-containing protein n=1 Tax=Fusarium ambrosium TaxID=131363 RepID=A0A428TM87_9HYPO|nr:hypothetical protein CDV31_010609 [Fusarium ambrosium]